MRWIGMSAAAFGLIAGISLGGAVLAFVNLPSFLFVLLVGGGVILASHGLAVVPLVWQAMVDRLHMSATDVSRAKAMAETGMQAFVAAGWIGVIVGSVQMLRQLDDPSHLGGGMATALLTPLYGYVLAYVFCLPLAKYLSEPLGESSRRESLLPGSEPTTTAGVS